MRSHLIIGVARLTGADPLAMGGDHHLLVVTAHIGHRVAAQSGLGAHTLAHLGPPEGPVTLVTRPGHAGHAHAHSEVREEVITVGSVALTRLRANNKPLTFGTRTLF